MANQMAAGSHHPCTYVTLKMMFHLGKFLPAADSVYCRCDIIQIKAYEQSDALSILTKVPELEVGILLVESIPPPESFNPVSFAAGVQRTSIQAVVGQEISIAKFSKQSFASGENIEPSITVCRCTSFILRDSAM